VDVLLSEVVLLCSHRGRYLRLVDAGTSVVAQAVLEYAEYAGCVVSALI